MTTLPVTSIALAAVEVGIVANRDLHAIDNMELQAHALERVGKEMAELQATQDPDGLRIDPVRMRALCDAEISAARQSATMLTQAHEWLKALSEYEPEIRALIERKTRSAAA